MIGHHTRLRENDDLPLWRGPAAKEKPPFFNAHVLITRIAQQGCAIQYWEMTLRLFILCLKTVFLW